MKSTNVYSDCTVKDSKVTWRERDSERETETEREREREREAAE